MEKRFVIFVVLSMLVLLGYQAIDMRLNPRPKPPVAADAADDQAAEHQAADNQVAADDGDANGAAGNGADAGPASASDGTGAQGVDAKTSAVPPGEDATAQNADSPVAGEPNRVEAAVRRETQPRRWATLGTLDPAKPGKLLAWFSNQGAAVECIAINDPRYTDLDDHYGYLGYLAWEEVPEGLRIGAVGDGTPAARAVTTSAGAAAGLQPGDIVQQANDHPIRTVIDFDTWLTKTHPGDTVSLTIRRGTGDQAAAVQYQTTLEHRPLEVIRPEPLTATATEPQHPLSYLLGLQQLGDKQLAYDEDELQGLPSLKNERWELRETGAGDSAAVEFHFVLTPAELQPFGIAGPLRIIKRFQMGQTSGDAGDAANPADPVPVYHLDYQLIFRHEGSEGPDIRLAFNQFGPTGLPLEGWWYTYKTHPTNFGGAGVRDIVSKSIGGKHKMFTNPKIVDRLDDNPENPTTPMYAGEPFHLQYVGVDAQYFTSALLADGAQAAEPMDENRFADVLCFPVAPKNTIKPALTDISFRLVSPIQTVPAGGQYEQRFRIFAGPKQPAVLATYGMDECITYGWFPLVAKPLTWILHTFYAIFRNYGVAIILLTVLVRGCMFPLGRQQALNAQKMQELAPEMRRIADLYKNDMEKRAAAQRELFQKHNYNPLAGCLPMFFQLPIFVGLYRALSVDIELRQAALIPGLRWCSNLAGPDQLLNWESWMPAMLASRTGWLGPYLNILPLISVAFMMVHQKMFTPPPTDEQQEIQQKMMKFMMLFFALMFFRVPAGLCLYFITSSAWGLAERKLLPKPKLATAAGPSPAAEPAASPGFLARFLPKPPTTNGNQASSSKRRPKSRRK